MQSFSSGSCLKEEAMPDKLKLAALAALLTTLSLLFLAWGLDQWHPYILELRSRKLITLILVGSSLGIATVIFQTLTANNILTPGMLGFDALFLFMQTGLLILLGTIGYATLPITLKFAVEVLIMVGAAVLLFSTLLNKTAGDITRLILAGVIIGILLRSLTSFMQRLLDPSEFAVLASMMFASFNAVDKTSLILGAIVMIICLIATLFIAPYLDVMSLGRNKARSLGVSYDRMVMISLAIIAVFVAIATSLVGPVTFLGLIVASLTRLTITSYRHIILLPTAAIIGASILVAGQFAFERLFQMQSALSIIIEFVGGIVFLILLLRKAAK